MLWCPLSLRPERANFPLIFVCRDRGELSTREAEYDE